KDIIEEYKILLHELEKYNPELLHKKRLLAITKCDMMLDDEMIQQMKPALPKDITSVFISAVSGMNVDKLKDMIWEQINS
ncbi:MAG: GTPase ObgE, partial [Flavobacteriales bacterium]|nr:GTPase ObgE [Flavobacteriales bacterium]